MTIHADDLDPDTRRRIGIGSPQPSEIVSPDIVALGTVLKVLKGLSNQKALYVLEQAMIHITGKGFPKVRIEEIPVTADMIIDAAAQVMDVDREDIVKQGRKYRVAEARQIVMYLLRINERNTLSFVGGKLGDRSPATITHGFQKIAKRLLYDKTLKAYIDEIELVIKRKTIILDKE